MQTPSYNVTLPDVLVRVTRAGSRLFFQLQASRYTPESKCKPNVGCMSLVMKTKTLLSQEKLNKSRLLPSVWSELYRAAVDELEDVEAKEIWGLVSTVISIVEQGAPDHINASAAIVEWHDLFDRELEGISETIQRLRSGDPRHDRSDTVEEIGSSVLGLIEGAFLTGHFDASAQLMDALLVYIRRGGSALLTAEVETALANVKRLLTVAFHDPDTHQQWVDAANDELRDSRIILLAAPRGTQSANDNDSTGSGDYTTTDRLVEDLCAACLDILLLITKDARRLRDRCHDSHRNATYFLVAVCAIMEPFADLERVCALFRKYVDEWMNTDGLQWYYECVLEILGVSSLADMVVAMQQVAAIAAAGFPQPEAGLTTGFKNEETYDSDSDDTDAISDTVNPNTVAYTEKSPSATETRRFMLACMTAHVADLCAPAVVAPSAADIHLTFSRNELITAYARIFALHPRTWRIAGLYVCYSPLADPLFLSEIVLAVAPMAAVDESVYRSLVAFLHTNWSTSSHHQQAVRAKLEAALPEHAAVAKWWSAMDYYYAESYREIHHHIIMTQLINGHSARAVWMAVKTQLTEVIESEVCRQLREKDALEKAELYMVGCAVHNGFISLDTCTNLELGRYLCAAAALSTYRQTATRVNSCLETRTQGRSSSLQLPMSPSHKLEATLEAVATCLQAIETALKCLDECHAMVHPSTVFTLVEHGAALLLSLRQLMHDSKTEDSTSSAYLTSCVLPLLIESYELANTHNVHRDPDLVVRSRALAGKLAHVHQTSI